MQRSRQDDRAGRGRLTVSLTATLPPVLQAACEKLAPWVAPRRHAACNFGLRGAAQSSVRALDRRHTLRPTSCVACSVSATFFSAASARASALTTFSHVFTCAALLIELGHARIHCKRYLRPLMYEQSVMQTVMWGPRRVRSASNQGDSLRALVRCSTRTKRRGREMHTSSPPASSALAVRRRCRFPDFRGRFIAAHAWCTVHVREASDGRSAGRMAESHTWHRRAPRKTRRRGAQRAVTTN